MLKSDSWPNESTSLLDRKMLSDVYTGDGGVPLICIFMNINVFLHFNSGDAADLFSDKLLEIFAAKNVLLLIKSMWKLFFFKLYYVFISLITLNSFKNTL